MLTHKAKRPIRGRLQDTPTSRGRSGIVVHIQQRVEHRGADNGGDRPRFD